MTEITKDKSYQANFAYHSDLATTLSVTVQRTLKATLSSQNLAKLSKLGKLPVRERIARLSDPETEFFEFSPLCAYNQYDNELPYAGIVTGLVTINGQDTVVIANDPLAKGGTYYPLTVKKHLRALEIARELTLNVVYIVDSGGAYLPLQSEIFPDKDHFGRIFYEQARLASLGIIQVALVTGSCTAGGAYIPAMADITIMTRHNSSCYLGGPLLVEAATGEKTTSAELGGAEVHCRISGLSDYLAEDEAHALNLVRSVLKDASRGGQKCTRNRETLQGERAPNLEPTYDPTEIYGILPKESKTLYNVRHIIARLVDSASFNEYKENYGSSLVCGYGYINKQKIGIIANNGILFSECALKGASFIELCSKSGTPLLFLQNIVGFMVGKRYEHGGIQKHGAMMIKALANSPVGKITILIGGSFGAGNYAMCGRAYNPNFLFAWPNSKIAVMGAQEASKVLVQLQKKNLQTQIEEDYYREQMIAKYETEMDPYYATSRLFDDGIIDPAHTRHVLERLVPLLPRNSENKFYSVRY